MEEQLGDVPGKFFGLLESPGIVTKGLVHGKGIFVVDVEGEVAGPAIEGWIAGDSRPLA